MHVEATIGKGTRITVQIMVKDTFFAEQGTLCVGVLIQISHLVIFDTNVVGYVSRHFGLKLLTDRGQGLGQAFQVFYTSCTTCFRVESSA